MRTFPQIEAGKYNDPLIGKRQLTELELRLLESPDILRLGEIKHAGTNPRSEHTRLEHSLGVAYLLRLACLNSGLAEDHPLTLFLTALGLCHDVGHGPFSHHMEKAFALYMKKRGEYKDGCSLHEVAATEAIFRRDTYKQTSRGSKRVDGIAKILADFNIDSKQLLNAIQGIIPSPLKGFKGQGTKSIVEFGADHGDSYGRDVFYGEEGKNTLINGEKAQQLYDTLSLGLRPNIKETASLVDASIVDLILCTTRLETASVFAHLARKQHQIIFSPKSIAIEYASLRLFELLLEAGQLTKDDYFKGTEGDVINKIKKITNNKEIPNHKEIARLYELIFKGGFKDPKNYSVTKISNSVKPELGGDEYGLKRTYEYALFVEDQNRFEQNFPTLIHELNARNTGDQTQVDLARSDLEEVTAMRGTYRVLLSGFSGTQLSLPIS